MARLSYKWAALVAALAISACSSGVTGTPTAAEAPGYSIAALLHQVPQSAGIGDDGTITLSTGDLNAASEQAGLTRPPSTASLDEQLDWIAPLTGVSREGVIATACLVPDAANNQQLAQHDQFGEEVGWNLWQVDTFISSSLPPDHFSAMTGRFDPSAIESALGNQTEGYWATAGEDYQQDLQNRTVASPLGQPLRVALDGSTLAVSLSTPDIRSWVTKDGATMADDAGVLAVAQALDGQKVYSAYLVRFGFGGTGGVLAPFDTVGVGVRVTDGKSELVLVYHHADEATSTANVEIVENLVAHGELLGNGAPISDLLTVQDVSSSGQVLTAILPMTEEASPNLGWSMLFQRDVFFIHS